MFCAKTTKNFMIKSYLGLVGGREKVLGGLGSWNNYSNMKKY
jgi:hypothetical protein